MQNDFQKVFRKLMEDKLVTRPHIAEKRTSIVFPFYLSKNDCGIADGGVHRGGGLRSFMFSDPGLLGVVSTADARPWVPRSSLPSPCQSQIMRIYATVH